MHFTSLFSMSSVLILLYYLIDMIRSYISPELKTFKNDEVWLSVIFNCHFDQIDAIFIKLFPYTQHTFMKTKKKTQEKNIARPIYICNLTIFISWTVRKILCLILCLSYLDIGATAQQRIFTSSWHPISPLYGDHIAQLWISFFCKMDFWDCCF